MEFSPAPLRVHAVLYVAVKCDISQLCLVVLLNCMFIELEPLIPMRHDYGSDAAGLGSEGAGARFE